MELLMWWHMPHITYMYTYYRTFLSSSMPHYQIVITYLYEEFGVWKMMKIHLSVKSFEEFDVVTKYGDVL